MNRDLLKRAYDAGVRRVSMTVNLDVLFRDPRAHSFTASALERSGGDEHAHGTTDGEALRSLLDSVAPLPPPAKAKKKGRK